MRNIVITARPGTEKFRTHISIYENAKDEQDLLDEGGHGDKIVAFVTLNCSDPSIRAIEAILELDSSEPLNLFQEIFTAGRNSVIQN